MDWSDLHTLDLRWQPSATFARLRGDVLPSLKDLTLDMGWPTADESEAILDFVTHTAQPLESLSLRAVESFPLATEF